MEENNQNKFFLDEGENEGPNKEERLLGAICYIPLGFLVPFLMHKSSSFLSFHFKQGLTLFLLYFITTTFIFALLPGFIMFRIGGILFMIYVGIVIFGGIKAYNGETYEFSFVRKVIDFMQDKFK